MAKIHYAPGASDSRTVAKSWEGKSYPPGWCLAFQVTKIYRVPGVGDYTGNRRANCADYWKKAKDHGTVVEETDGAKFPAGVMAIWKGGAHGDGHAAYCFGDATILSTDQPRRGKVGRVSIEEPHKDWGLTLVGYVVVDGNGFTLVRETVPKPPAPKPDVYKVRPKIGLNARSGPTTTSKVLAAVKQGTKVTAVKVVVGTDGKHWVVDAKKRYFAKAYLDKV